MTGIENEKVVEATLDLLKGIAKKVPELYMKVNLKQKVNHLVNLLEKSVKKLYGSDHYTKLSNFPSNIRIDFLGQMLNSEEIRAKWTYEDVKAVAEWLKKYENLTVPQAWIDNWKGLL